MSKKARIITVEKVGSSNVVRNYNIQNGTFQVPRVMSLKGYSHEIKINLSAVQGI